MNIAGARSYDDVADIGELYDHVALYSARRDVPFYIEVARAAAGPVLELGCGTGRVLIPVAQTGIAVTGVERSTGMLSRCREKVAGEPPLVRRRIELRAGDVRSFDLRRQFSLITAPFRAFQHLVDVADQMACLERVRRHLAQHGSFVFDVFNPDLERLAIPSTDEREDTAETALPGERRFRRTARVAAIDRAAQVSSVELTYYVTGADGREERRVQAFPMRWFLRYELEHLLARCGFAVREIFGDFDRSPLRQSSPEIVVVATKA